MASVAQAPRRLATKSPQVEPAATTAEDRRERKRASDRLAQREHRKRQREYIDELEAQLKLIKEGSHSESVAVLVAENERLKAELQQLRAFASSINVAMSQLQGNIGTSHPVSPAPSNPNMQHSLAQQETTEAPSGEPPSSNHKSDGPIPASILGSSSLETSFPAPPGSSHGYDQAYARKNEPQRDILDFDTISHENLESSHFADSMLQPTPEGNHLARADPPESLHTNTHKLPEDIHSGDIYPSLLSRSMWDRLGQLDLAILPDIGYNKPFLSSEGHDSHPFPTPTPLQSHDVLMRDARPIQPQSTPSQLPHKSIPNILFPALQDDEVLYAMVESARWQAVISDTKIPKPELVDCVLDSTANHFSLELKQYLEPMRRLRRNEEYFACYWLIATLVRWYVHQEESLYNNVPTWLRPTALELRIPHPLLISFMPWPLMRNQLILDFHIHRVPIHPIMADLGEFLETKLSCAAGGLCMGEDQLVQSLKDLKNWSLKPGFFERHPQFRNSYQQYVV
ncbi:hypothetical protein ASPCAL12313 [Aspergillus calidoustus]|uniref:BZIP domain-containing protein n=1 Tax=Aspergillus calidoustus TaxID=454130 RepID=A0A0U4ZHP2_ASPCI|nr:hypothetical protein ASPCAL12313 [Aspergillus calidoustus]